MRVFLDNVDINSNTGPNNFGKKLVLALQKRNHQLVSNSSLPDVQLSFIMASGKWAPIVQRLDGIYFNSRQDWNALNAPIRQTYGAASAVVFQSHFNRVLSEKYFGVHVNGHVIHNGTDVPFILSSPPISHPALDQCDNIWTCASNWRPHKRLKENIRYFLEHSGPRDGLVVAGQVNEQIELPQDRKIFFVGDVPWETLVRIYRRSKYFIHLSFIDHCPNVVIDARAAGCHIICSSSGGTHEIAGLNSTVVEESTAWDMSPLDLYSPPPIDFGIKRPGIHDSVISIDDVAEKYIQVMHGVCRENSQ